MRMVEMIKMLVMIDEIDDKHCQRHNGPRLLSLKLESSLCGATCIRSKFGHQVAPLALVQHLDIRWCHLHCHIALNCPIVIYQQVLSWYLHQPESTQLSLQKVLE